MNLTLPCLCSLVALALVLSGCAPVADPNAIHSQAAVDARMRARAAAGQLPAYRREVRDYEDFTRAEEQSVYFRAIEGAVGMDTASGTAVVLETGEPLHIVSTNPTSGSLLAVRKRHNSTIYISRVFVESSQPEYIVVKG